MIEGAPARPDAWKFPPSGTIVAARVDDGSGLAGLTHEMVVRIGEGTGTAAATLDSELANARSPTVSDAGAGGGETIGGDR